MFVNGKIKLTEYNSMHGLSDKQITRDYSWYFCSKIIHRRTSEQNLDEKKLVHDFFILFFY